MWTTSMQFLILIPNLASITQNLMTRPSMDVVLPVLVEYAFIFRRDGSSNIHKRTDHLLVAGESLMVKCAYTIVL